MRWISPLLCFSLAWCWPFGKFFHLIERPATVGIELYWRTGENTTQQRCARCGEEFAPARFIQDLKRTLYEVGEDYTIREAPPQPFGVPVDEPPVKGTPIEEHEFSMSSDRGKKAAMSVDKGIFHRQQRLAETFDYHSGMQSPTPWRSDEHIEYYVPTHCCYCGVQCGMYLKVAGGKVVGVEPRDDFPLNHGMSSATGANERSLGIDRAANSVSDMLHADCIFVIGANVGECFPIITSYLWQARDRGCKLIVADPRQTPIARTADIFLPLRSGTDSAKVCGLRPDAIIEAARMFGRAQAALICTARGLEHQSKGVDNGVTAVNLALAMARLRDRAMDRAGAKWAKKPRNFPAVVISRTRKTAHISAPYGASMRRTYRTPAIQPR